MHNKHNTPDWVYLQAFNETIYDRVNKRFQHINETTNLILSSAYSPIRSSKRLATLKLKCQGKFVQAKIAYLNVDQHKRAKRGEIRDFSKQSRGRLIDLFNSLEMRSKAIFLTLTYGEDYPNAETAKNHLRAFLERIRRFAQREGLSGIWRLEFQERGAPHFHLILFQLPWIAKEKIQKWWGEITRTERPFTRIEMIHSHKKLVMYASKYIAKVNPSENGGFNPLTYLHAYRAKYGDNIGRLWGTMNKSALPWAELYEINIPLDYGKFLRFRDLAAKEFPPIKDSLSLGFRLYVVSAPWWWHKFHDIYDIMF